MRQPLPPSPQSSTPPAPSALEGLRTATGALHAQLDSDLPIGRAEAVLADYVSHLQTLRPWLLKSQAMLRAAKASGLEAAACRIGERLEKIDADLADAGQPLPVAAALDLPAGTCPADAAAGAAGSGWGRAYVVEGSALGGRVLFKRLQERLSPHPLRYLAGDAAASPRAAWSDFTAQLDAHLATPAQRLEAQQGAVAAFSELLDAFGLGARRSGGCPRPA